MPGDLAGRCQKGVRVSLSPEAFGLLAQWIWASALTGNLKDDPGYRLAYHLVTAIRDGAPGVHFDPIALGDHAMIAGAEGDDGEGA